MTLAHEIPSGTKPPRGLRMSYEEFLEATFDHDHYEWVDGEAVEMGQIDSEHSDIQIFLIALLAMYLDSRPIGVLKAEPFHMKIGPDLPGRCPDLMFIATENLAKLERLTLRGPADLAVEIISTSSRRTDRIDKRAEYEQGGVKEYWIIDPQRRNVEFYNLIDGHYIPGDIDEDGRLLSKVLPGVWFRDAWFFDRPAKVEVLKQWGLVT